MTKKDLDKFKGCLVGGAAGDALGYAVEFYSLREIQSQYGACGIREYKLRGGKAVVSDDTQMTLFTASGLLSGAASEEYLKHIWRAYKGWFKTQGGGVHEGEYDGERLVGIPELNAERAPGLTCLTSMESAEGGSIKSPINDSKGCGGIMRVAPVGLFFCCGDPINAAKLGAEAAALTHGHELGYIPAAAFVYLIHALAAGEKNLEAAVVNSLSAAKEIFPEASHLQYFTELVNYAIELAKTDMPDTEAIKKLGEGWVAEETYAIAVYCALKYRDDFEKAIVASVNHDGDSDSTGAVTGNIMGALLGLQHIPQKFIKSLELEQLIEEVAEELYSSSEANT